MNFRKPVRVRYVRWCANRIAGSSCLQNIRRQSKIHIRGCGNEAFIDPPNREVVFLVRVCVRACEVARKGSGRMTPAADTNPLAALAPLVTTVGVPTGVLVSRLVSWCPGWCPGWRLGVPACVPDGVPACTRECEVASRPPPLGATATVPAGVLVSWLFSWCRG